MSQLGLDNKTIIITGAGGGLGRAFALGFAKAGAHIVIADMNLKGAEETATLVREAGAKALVLQTDVADEASTQAMAAQTLEKFGAIDVLINNAAVYATLKRQNFFEITTQEWDKVMAVNIKGPFLCAKAVQGAMRGRGGRIINIASATVLSGSPLWMHYVTSKGGLIAMTRVMARELGDANITVNAIAPGFTLSEASLNLVENAANYGVDRGAIKRASQPEDMVGAALWLASPLSAYVTGQTIVVDGGKQFI